MKSKVLLLIGALIPLFFLTNCGGNSNLKNNDYLGTFPSLVKQYFINTQSIKDDMNKASNNGDAKKARKLMSEYEQEKQKFKTKIDNSLKEHSLKGKELPFEPLENTSYTVKKVTVQEASIDGLGLKFHVQIDKDIKGEYGLEKHLNIYYKAIDTEGNDIKGSQTLVRNNSSQLLKAGNTIDHLNSFYKGSEILNFEDFAKFVEITKEEYDQK